MEKLQKRKWLFLIVAVVLLAIWVVLGISSRKSQPEAIVNKFFRAYEKQNVEKMVKCYAPELQQEMREELKQSDYLSELRGAASKLVSYKVIVGDVVYKKGEEANTAEVSCAVITKGGDSMSVCDFSTLSLVKAGKKWYIGE